jgi:hypothetical protein
MKLAVEHMRIHCVIVTKEIISSVGASPPTERQHALTRRPHRTILILMLK